jgi:hypothetical protein
LMVSSAAALCEKAAARITNAPMIARSWFIDKLPAFVA